ncbi:MAG: FAD-dependent oxidoreductase, partial [Cyanobacteria bacterium J06642_11]
MLATVTGLVMIQDTVTGVLTPTQAYAASNVVVAAGGYSRRLLHHANLRVPLYHTHAEIVALPNVETKLRAMIMPAVAQRFAAESAATDPATDYLWDGSPQTVVPPILDSGVIQCLDRATYIGQISRFRTDLTPDTIDAVQSEMDMRRAITAQLPCLADVPGQWRHCLVSFTRDGLPLLGPLPGIGGLHLFTGFTSPFAMLLPIAQQFAQWVSQGETSSNPSLEKMWVTRFRSDRPNPH